MIPRKIHQIWLGPKKMPARLMQSWKDMHPGWEHHVWTEANMPVLRNADKLSSIEEWAGKADIARYEILLEHGGVYCDADSLCIRPMDDYLLERDCFAVFENEQVRQGLVANGYIGASRGCRLMSALVDGISRKPVSQAETGQLAWQTVGPLFFTETIMRERYPIDVFPSWMFIPEHYSGVTYKGDGKPYCRQYWGSTMELQNPNYYNELE